MRSSEWNWRMCRFKFQFPLAVTVQILPEGKIRPQVRTSRLSAICFLLIVFCSTILIKRFINSCITNRHKYIELSYFNSVEFSAVQTFSWQSHTSTHEWPIGQNNGHFFQNIRKTEKISENKQKFRLDEFIGIRNERQRSSDRFGFQIVQILLPKFTLDDAQPRTSISRRSHFLLWRTLTY